MLPLGADAPLPPDGMLLHIGPHKTGTTALQGAFHQNRDRLRELGVVYAGRGRQPMLAALAMTGRPGRRGDPTARPRHWKALTREVAATPTRTVVSSERFCVAAPEQIGQIVDGLGGPRVHVAITLRPLAKILPSQWQQYVQNGLRMSYDQWLHHIFDDARLTKPTPDFWTRHAHDELVQRWAAAVGPERVVVVVLDDRDPQMLMRAFEGLLALPSGVLEVAPDLSNRSLTAGEVEVIRLLNEEFRHNEWSHELYAQFVRLGVAAPMRKRQPSPDEPRVTTPKWAVERAAQVGAAAAAAIGAYGVNVVGDLTRLGEMPSSGWHEGDVEPSLLLPPQAATAALVGTIRAAAPARQSDGGQRGKQKSLGGAEAVMSTVRSATLLRILGRRVQSRVAARLGRPSSSSKEPAGGVSRPAKPSPKSSPKGSPKASPKARTGGGRSKRPPAP